MLSYLLSCGQLLLAAILFTAAFRKLVQPGQLVSAIKTSGVPKILVVPTAFSTIAIEQFLAVGLIFSPTGSLPLVLIANLILFTVFTLWLVVMYKRDLGISCGCFGFSKQAVGLRSIARNLGLLIVVAVSLALSFITPGLPPPPAALTGWLIVGLGLLNIGLLLLLGRFDATSLIQLFTSNSPDAPKQLLLRTLPTYEAATYIANALETKQYASFKTRLQQQFEVIDFQETACHALSRTRHKDIGVMIPYQLNAGRTGNGFYVVWLKPGSGQVRETTTGLFRLYKGQTVGLRLEQNERVTLDVWLTPAGEIAAGHVYNRFGKEVRFKSSTLAGLSRLIDSSARLLIFG